MRKAGSRCCAGRTVDKVGERERNRPSLLNGQCSLGILLTLFEEGHRPWFRRRQCSAGVANELALLHVLQLPGHSPTIDSCPKGSRRCCWQLPWRVRPPTLKLLHRCPTRPLRRPMRPLSAMSRAICFTTRPAFGPFPCTWTAMVHLRA